MQGLEFDDLYGCRVLKMQFNAKDFDGFKIVILS